MAFPTVHLLDSFKRAENPLSKGNGTIENAWQTYIAAASKTGLCDGGRKAWETANPASAHQGAYWTPQQFGGKLGVAYTRNEVITSRGTWFLIANMVNPLENSMKCYDLAVGQAGGGHNFEWKLRRIDEWGSSEIFLLGSGEITLENKDSIGLAVQEGQVQFWHKKEVAGAWALVEGVADTTYKEGYVGFWAEEAAVGDLINFETGGSEGLDVTAPPHQYSNVGKAVSLQIEGEEVETYTAIGLPAGLSINSSTGLITGTPTTEETVTVRIIAENAKPESAEIHFEWTIRPEVPKDTLDMIV